MGVDARMAISTPKELSDEELFEMDCQLRECFGSEYRVGRYPHDPRDREWNPPLPALVVGLYCDRYYGRGYERGDIVKHLAIAAFFEVMVPGCLVFYGGDSTDWLEEFVSPDRKKVFEYFCRNAYRPYRQGFDTEDIPNCPDCRRPNSICGWGPYGKRSSQCLVCGKRLEQANRGKPWTVEE